VLYVWSTGIFKMIFKDLTTCHTQHIWDSSICIFLFNRATLQVLLHTLQLFYKCTLCDSTVLFEMTVGGLTTCHTQYNWYSGTCIFYLIEHFKFLLHTLHIPELKVRIRTAIETTTDDMLQTVCNEMEYCVDVCRKRPPTIERCIMGSARRPTTYATLKHPYRVRVLSPIQEQAWILKLMWEETKKHVYTFVYITIDKWFVFFSVYFFTAIQMPAMRLNWVEYGSSWCCEWVITGWQRGEL